MENFQETPANSGPLWGEYWQLSYPEIQLAGQVLCQANEQLAQEFQAQLETVPMWLSREDLQQSRKAQASSLVDCRGKLLAQFSPSSTSSPTAPKVHQAQNSRALRYPWDLLHAHEQALKQWAEKPWAEAGAQILGPAQLPQGVHATEPIHLGQGSRILPGVVIEGPVWIGKNCRIGPHAYLRGPVAIADSSVVGHAVELKNVLMAEHSAIAHLSYVGDSVIGQQVNFGAGTIVANYRHDGRNHHSLWRGEKIDTERKKFGSIIGDQVRLGINTCIYPGRKLAKASQTLPGEVVSEDQ